MMTDKENSTPKEVKPSSATSAASRKCSSCQKELSRDSFSKAQWKKKKGSLRRCKACITLPASTLIDLTNARTTRIDDNDDKTKPVANTIQKLIVVTDSLDILEKEEAPPTPTVITPHPLPTRVCSSPNYEMVLYKAQQACERIESMKEPCEDNAAEVLQVCTDALLLPCFQDEVLDQLCMVTHGKPHQTMHEEQPEGGASFLYTQLVCAAARAEITLGQTRVALKRVTAAQDRITLTWSCFVELGMVQAEALAQLGRLDQARQVREFLEEVCIEKNARNHLCAKKYKLRALTLKKLCASPSSSSPSSFNGGMSDKKLQLVPVTQTENVSSQASEVEKDMLLESSGQDNHFDKQEADECLISGSITSIEKGHSNGDGLEEKENRSLIVEDLEDEKPGKVNATDTVKSADLEEEKTAMVAVNATAKSTKALSARTPSKDKPDISQNIYGAYKTAFGKVKSSVFVVGPILGLTEAAASMAIEIGSFGKLSLCNIDQSVITPPLQVMDDFIFNPVISTVVGSIFVPAVKTGEHVVHMVASLFGNVTDNGEFKE